VRTNLDSESPPPANNPLTLQKRLQDYHRWGHSIQDANKIPHSNPSRFVAPDPYFGMSSIRVEPMSYFTVS